MLHQLYDYSALFQAKAYILKEPREVLLKYLDVPAFGRGDLFYIQNLVVALETPYSSATTFVDVPVDHPYYWEIEALYQAGYTAGCHTDPLMYCPDNSMIRAESAVFVERGVHGTGYEPSPPSVSSFADVPAGDWGEGWIEGLWDDGYTAGCGTDPLIYCPLAEHTRAEGCVFYLRMLNGAEYEPPEGEGVFEDVPVGWWGTGWVEAAVEAGLIEACQEGAEVRFCPNDPLSRGLAAYMMVQAKGLAGSVGWIGGWW
jgi:hypothetical protein